MEKTFKLNQTKLKGVIARIFYKENIGILIEKDKEYSESILLKYLSKKDIEDYFEEVGYDIHKMIDDVIEIVNKAYEKRNVKINIDALKHKENIKVYNDWVKENINYSLNINPDLIKEEETYVLRERFKDVYFYCEEKKIKFYFIPEVKYTKKEIYKLTGWKDGKSDILINYVFIKIVKDNYIVSDTLKRGITVDPRLFTIIK